MADTYSVVDSTYPASGDHLTIQDAIDSGARSIYVRAGLYSLTGSITVPQGTTIIGENSGTTILDSQEESWNVILNGYDIVIQGLKVINCRHSIGTFEFNGVQNCKVRDCTVEDSNRAAFFRASTFCHFENCQTRRLSLEGIMLDVSSTDNRVINCRVREGTNYGIFLYGAFNKILNCSVSGHINNDGIFVGSTQNTIHHNTVNSNQNGIYIAWQNGDNNVLMGNICNGNAGYGIAIHDIEDNSGNVIMGNSARDNGVADIRGQLNNIVIGNDAGTIV